MQWGRRRRGGKGRIPSPVFIERPSINNLFTPSIKSSNKTIQIEPSELEVMRLIDLESLSQEEAGEKMKVSRGTIWRLLESGRKKVMTALVEGLTLEILGGNPTS